MPIALLRGETENNSMGNISDFIHFMPNARLRGWQRITLNSNITAVTTAAHWDWKRHALTVSLEAFVMLKLQHFTFEPNQ